MSSDRYDEGSFLYSWRGVSFHKNSNECSLFQHDFFFGVGGGRILNSPQQILALYYYLFVSNISCQEGDLLPCRICKIIHMKNKLHVRLPPENGVGKLVIV